MSAGTYAFWGLAISATLTWLSVVLKLTWWRSTIGVWFFAISVVMGLVAAFIFTLQLGIYPQWIVQQARAIIYSSVSLVLLALAVDIWRKNWNRWAWSKEDE